MARWYRRPPRRPLNPARCQSIRAADDTIPTVSEALGFITFRSEHEVAVRIRLLRMGKIRNPQYRIVIADSRTKRDGRAIEQVGIYHPKEEPSRIEVNSERVQHWLSVGAQPSEAVQAILSKTGDWQRFKGLPAPTEPLRVAAARTDRRATYEAEAKAAAGLAEPPPAKAAKKAAEPKRAAKKAAKDAEAEDKVDVEAPAAQAEEQGGAANDGAEG
jgi:small subunit ribosomal protein S16